MLKHIVGEHPEQEMGEVKFGMQVLKYTCSSFGRQIMESVLIQQERDQHQLLNSRTEYNRCSLPRLCKQMGEGEYPLQAKQNSNEEQENSGPTEQNK